MQTLNLPSYNFKITHKEEGDFIFDVIRKKNILLTPEEWVRQHIIHYLHKNLGYPKGLLKVESGVMYNARMKRSDIIIYDRKGSPSILVECKAPSVKINQSTVEQAAMYNRTLNASVIILTNGVVHYTFKLDDKGVLINLDEIPKYKA
ncbi:hypothetical protein MNBD_GAMMA03-129 [hydrothermal vent metagenome]|uniref:Type I restriction enzyme R protein N-terminal domain-containing protein n=1 Tax=hydrothermal vent metagenome TaxID=652676 RepID=A0A3B0W2U6_9ZZZZ